MAEGRTYRDDEVRQIFEEAAARRELPARRSAPEAEGLSLAELQGIGAEVGLDPGEVARAAAALDARALQPAPRTSLGVPVEVNRVVPLPRALTDAEWDVLVAELRATFRARGRVQVQGGLREWANGNLHACVEPTPTGHQLRLGTLKGDARGLNAMAAVALGAGAVGVAGALTGGAGLESFVGPGMIGAAGLAGFLANRLRLPRWADERRRQMEHVAARVPAILGAPLPAPPEG